MQQYPAKIYRVRSFHPEFLKKLEDNLASVEIKNVYLMASLHAIPSFHLSASGLRQDHRPYIQIVEEQLFELAMKLGLPRSHCLFTQTEDVNPHVLEEMLGKTVELISIPVE